jgi:hypothetical protein
MTVEKATETSDALARGHCGPGQSASSELMALRCSGLRL